MTGEILHQGKWDHRCEPPCDVNLVGGRCGTYFPPGSIWQCECGKVYRTVADSRGICIWRQTSLRRARRLLRRTGVEEFRRRYLSEPS